MSFKRKYNMRVELIPLTDKRPCMRQGTKIKPEFGVAHDVGNKNATAQNHLDLAMRLYDDQWAWAHFFNDDRDIIIMIPMFETAEKCCHVLDSKEMDNILFGNNSNSHALGGEMCYFTDKNRTLESYKRYIHMWAYLCHYYNWNPLDKITGHHILDPERKTDPMNAFNIIGKTFEQFLQDVKDELDECTKEVLKFDIDGNLIEIDEYIFENNMNYVGVRQYEERQSSDVTWREEDRTIVIRRNK